MEHQDIPIALARTPCVDIILFSLRDVRMSLLWGRPKDLSLAPRRSLVPRKQAQRSHQEVDSVLFTVDLAFKQALSARTCPQSPLLWDMLLVVDIRISLC